MKRDRQQPAGLRVGLDVKGQQREPGSPIGREYLGVVEDRVDPVAGTRVATDLDRSADSPVDEVAVGEAYVRFVATDSRRRQLVAQRRCVLRDGDVDANDRFPVETDPVPARTRVDAEHAGPIRIRFTDEEVRDRSIIADQEGPALRELAVEQHHRPAGFQPVGRLQDEAQGHQTSIL